MGLLSSSSKSTSNNTTINNDRRIVADANGIGVSGDGVNVNVLDGGVIARTLSSFDAVRAAQTDGLTSILGAAKDMFKLNSEAATSNAAMVNQSVLEAYSNATTDKAGTIDNKTLIALAVAGVIVVYFMRKKS